MSLPIEHVMEQLNQAYVSAVVASAGATYDAPKQDYGIDGRVSEVRRFPNGKYIATNLSFNCQLKATTDFSIRDTNLAYEIEVNALSDP